MQDSEIYDFGPFTVDLPARALRRGRDVIPVTPKQFETLTLLVRNPGKLVTKDEMIRQVWPDTFVEEGSISQNIFQLRRILGDGYIQTVPRRGYRFAPSSTTIASIAVLPFVNLTANPEFGYFCDGITDEIISILTAVEGLRVPARSSVFQFRGKPVDIRDLGNTLNVSAVLEGSVRAHGQRIKVGAQLSSVADGYCMWSDTYIRDGEDVLALQHDIASAIVGSLKLQTPATRQQSGNVRAYHLYLKGRHMWNNRPTGLDRAIDFFQRAIAEDPEYALAYAGLADCHATQSAWESGTLAPREGFPKARALAERALELDPRLAEAHTTLAYTDLHYAWDFDAAERGFRRALALNAGYPAAHHWYSHLLTAAGRTDESLRESLTTADLDPLDLVANVHMAWHYFYAGDLDEMETSLGLVRELHPAAHWTAFFTGWLQERRGNYRDAAAAFERAVAASDGSTVMRTAAARAWGLAGAADRARAELADLRQLRAERYVSSYELALIHAALGEQEEAFRELERACEERSAWLAYLDVEPRLEDLRGHQRFGPIAACIPRTPGDAVSAPVSTG